jgi:nucleoside-diphosphate-sugar epimerase
MKALVTGATGFIGSHLCEELVKRGYSVTCLVREISSLKWIDSLDLKFIKGDCTDKESILNAMHDFDYIFHLAGLTKSCSDDAFFFINAKGTENLITAVAERNLRLKRFVYLSSLAAVGPSKNGTPVDEHIQPSPVSNYGRSKLEGEKAILKYKDTIPITILRPAAVYGPRDRDFLVLFKMIKKGISPHCGKAYYSFLYVDDLVQGIILCAENKEAEGKAFFLAENAFYSNEEVVKVISSVLNAKALRFRVPKFVIPFCSFIGEKTNTGIINKDKMKEFIHSHWTCNAQKAQDEIGFFPKVVINKGMKWTADWYRIHRWL